MFLWCKACAGALNARTLRCYGTSTTREGQVRQTQAAHSRLRNRQSSSSVKRCPKQRHWHLKALFNTLTGSLSLALSLALSRFLTRSQKLTVTNTSKKVTTTILGKGLRRATQASVTGVAIGFRKGTVQVDERTQHGRKGQSSNVILHQGHEGISFADSQKVNALRKVVVTAAVSLVDAPQRVV